MCARVGGQKFLPPNPLPFCPPEQLDFKIRNSDFLKKIGSNFRIVDRTLACDFKNAFKIAEKYHAEALCAEASNLDISKCDSWRREGDSNPRGSCPPIRFPSVRLKPLGHLS